MVPGPEDSDVGDNAHGALPWVGPILPPALGQPEAQLPNLG